MVSQKFWGIVGRVVLVYLAIYFVMFLLMSGKNNVLSIIGVIFSLFTGPFIISYLYEIYKNLQEPKEVKTPVVWVVLSVLGWVVSIVVLAFSFYAIVNAIMNLKTNPFEELQKYQQMKGFDQKDFDINNLKVPTLPPLPDSI